MWKNEGYRKGDLRIGRARESGGSTRGQIIPASERGSKSKPLVVAHAQSASLIESRTSRTGCQSIGVDPKCPRALYKYRTNSSKSLPEKHIAACCQLRLIPQDQLYQNQDGSHMFKPHVRGRQKLQTTLMVLGKGV